ncbi:YD repeat-containing protein [Chitinophaga costaii]|uniref:YD repeat-containing protein n=1 Tax=Chitinophaga costaii TaxID=1335309 RepID=A0A1C4FG41_9BACT|nr:hypothetical protein [Chitinophaga costaii]PUZ20133.1 hypothetical protein DCM91_19575 [Chitinophaga costaii]SCC54824.1 YD repeat-containing protein [Chitinophaga costaii]
METTIKPGRYLLAALAIFLLSNCHKEPGNLNKSPNVDSSIVNAMYPKVQSFYDAGASSTVYKSIITYDKDNHIQEMARDSTLLITVKGSTVNVITNTYTYKDKYTYYLNYQYIMSYVFSFDGLGDPNSTIYNKCPLKMESSFYENNVAAGTTQSRPATVEYLSGNKEGYPLQEMSSDGDGYNYNYTYDDNGNLKQITFITLSGPRSSQVYGRVNVISLDNKPSPFSAVKGYWIASFPQGYNWDYALAFCKNNPLQMTHETYNSEKGRFMVTEKDDFLYTYNDQGYPTQVSIDISYYSNVDGSLYQRGVRVYNYTY